MSCEALDKHLNSCFLASPIVKPTLLGFTIPDDVSVLPQRVAMSGKWGLERRWPHAWPLSCGKQLNGI